VTVAPYSLTVADRPLREGDVDADPFVEVAHWYDDAVVHGALAPDAMIVATATADGRPSARAVLLRGVDARGFCFYTSYDSRKGHELESNPRAAIVLHWPEVQRQIRATGRVERVAEAESRAYWVNRPRPARVSAWASKQSSPIASRAALEAVAADVEARFDGDDVPLPPFWGGYRVVPDEIELWQHRDDRLHDRLLYRREGGGWRIVRLQP